MSSSIHHQSARLLALLVLVATLMFATAAPAVRAAESGDQQVDKAVEWLVGQQVENGGFSAFGPDSDPGSTSDVILALAAAGIDPATVTSPAGNSPIDYLRSVEDDAATDPGVAGKVVLALVAAGEDAADLVAAIQDGVDPGTGFYGMGVVNHSYALLALAATGAEVDAGAIDALLEAQIEDGSWSFTGENVAGTGDTNSTALAIQALAAHSAGGDAIGAGLDYLLSMRDDAGVIAYDASEAPDITGDANSTAVSIQAMIAAGHDPSEQLDSLTTFQNDSGAFFWREDMADDSLLATAQSVPALLGQALPISPEQETSAGSTGTSTAGLVIRHGDGTIVQTTVEFEEDSIDGLELITRSGFDATVAPFGGMGGAVCALNGEGCPSDDCFCQSYSDPAYFWNYFILEDGEWVPHPLGPSSRELQDGDIDGWSWTSGESMLPAVTIDVIASSPTDPNDVQVPDASDDDSSSGTYMIAAGMAMLVVLVGAVVVARNRIGTR